MPEEKNKNEKSTINREFKDRIFRYIFAHEKNRELTLSLYNAVSGKNYTNPDDMEITTLNDVLYMSMKNDLSFIIDDTMNIYEHQSSVNPNMPVRMLLYAADVYKKYIEKNIRRKIFSSSQQKLPVPKLICFYNGIRKTEDRTIISLRDAFETDENTEPDIDVRVTMLNINYGHNQELMNACQPLKEYSWFIDKVRNYTKEYRKNEEPGYAEKAVDRAIDEMPTDWILKQFLVEHRSEVRSMWMTEYDEQAMWDDIRAAYQEDIEEKAAKAAFEKTRADKAENQICRNVVTMLKDQMSDEMILRYTGISPEKLQEIKEIGGQKYVNDGI